MKNSTTQSLFFSLFLILLLSLNNFSIAQGWERNYGDTNNTYVYFGVESIELNDHNILTVGYRDTVMGGFSQNKDLVVLKLSSVGDTLWSILIDSTFSQLPTSVVEVNGDFYLSGYFQKQGLSKDIFLIKLDHNGNQIYRKTFGGSSHDEAADLIKTSDGNLIIGGVTQSFGQGQQDAYLIKIDLNGDTLWTNTYGYSTKDFLRAMCETVDGNIAITGKSDRNAASPILFALLDAAGNKLFDTSYISVNPNDNYYSRFQGSGIIQSSDSNFVIVGTAPSSIFPYIDFILKIDQTGNVIFNATDQAGFYGGFHNKVVEINNSYYVVGLDGNFGSYGVIVKYDYEGSREWRKYLPHNIIPQYAGRATLDHINVTHDGYLIATGRDIINKDILVVKVDENGRSFLNKISGYVYDDKDLDCQRDSSENPAFLNNRYRAIKISPGPRNQAFEYIPIGAGGYYEIYTDAGSYTLNFQSPDLFESFCPDTTGNINLTISGQSVSSTGNNFGIRLVDSCTSPTINITSTRVRACRTITINIDYCNKGISVMNSANIIAKLPDSINITHSSIPWASRNGNTFNFNIPTIGAFKCNRIQLQGTVGCTVSPNSSFCFEASISPQTNCAIDSMSWDGSDLKVEGDCLGDSLIQFKIKNSSLNDMQGFASYQLFEDTTLIKVDSLMLLAGDSQSITFYSNSKLYYLKQDQRPDHPNYRFASKFIENCGGATTSSLRSFFPEENKNEISDIICNPVFNSYDPNDKQGLPIGRTNQNFIEPDVPIDYTIRFQNLGNDTAYKVVIRDSIDIDQLNLSSIRFTGESHPASINIKNLGVVEWTFDNINLVDSATDPINSEGYVQYTIEQNQNQIGDLISNTAYIYFDGNFPIKTNTIQYKVWDSVYVADTAKMSVDLQLDSNFYCQYDSIQPIVSVSNGFGPYTIDWILDDTVSFSKSQLALTGQDSGRYKLKLQVTDNFNEIADTTVFYNVGLSPASSFNFTTNQRSVLFNNTSRDTLSPNYLWDFGNGMNSTGFSPTHTYSNDSVYSVCLKVWNINGCFADTCDNQVVILSTELEEFNEYDLKIYPNPVKSNLHLDLIDNSSSRINNIQLFDLNGKELIRKHDVAKTNILNLDDVARGTYLLKLEINGQQFIKKIIKD